MKPAYASSHLPVVSSWLVEYGCTLYLPEHVPTIMKISYKEVLANRWYRFKYYPHWKGLHEVSIVEDLTRKKNTVVGVFFRRMHGIYSATKVHALRVPTKKGERQHLLWVVIAGGRRFFLGCNVFCKPLIGKCNIISLSRWALSCRHRITQAVRYMNFIIPPHFQNKINAKRFVSNNSFTLVLSMLLTQINEGFEVWGVKMSQTCVTSVSTSRCLWFAGWISRLGFGQLEV